MPTTSYFLLIRGPQVYATKSCSADSAEWCPLHARTPRRRVHWMIGSPCHTVAYVDESTTSNNQRRHCWPLVVDLYAPNCSRPSRSHERHDEQFFLESRVTCVTQFYSQSVCRDRGRVSVSQEGKTSSMVGRSAVWSFNTTSL